MSPSEQLKQANIENWLIVSNHPFCIELSNNSLDLDKMRLYLGQDYTFIDSFVRLASCTIQNAPSLADRLPLAHFLGNIAGPENTYFQRSFETLGVPKSQQDSPKILKPTSDFQALMLKAVNSGEYANMLAVLCVAEWIYLSWAKPLVHCVESLPFYFGEWITLHSGEYFESFVEYLRTQLDTAFSNATFAQQETVKEYFNQAVVLEKQFFDACYQA